MVNQQEVVRRLKELSMETWRSPEGDGTFVYPRLPPEGDMVEEYNAYRPEATLAETKVIVNEEEDDELTAAPEEISPELEEILSSIAWCKRGAKNLGCWQKEIVCPEDIIGRVMGAQRSFANELEAAYAGFTLTVERSSTRERAADAPYLRNAKTAGRGALLLASHETDKVSLAKAIQEVEARILANMKYAQYTHFLSLPFLRADNDEFPERCKEFFNAVDEGYYVGKDVKKFNPLGLMHFTLIMLRLYTDEDIARVVNCLKKIASRHILFTDDSLPDMPPNVVPPPHGLHMHLKGVYCMDEDERSANVIFTKEQTAGFETNPWLRLRRPAMSFIDSLIEEICSAFIDEGIVDPEELVQDRLIDSSGAIKRKLHVTLINSKLGNRKPFDAGPLLRRFREFDFGVGVITGLHISKRGTPAPDTYYYQPEFVLPIRPNTGV